MQRIRKAKRAFKGTCGHEIKPGDKFVVVETEPQFLCSTCAPDVITARLAAMLDELAQSEERRTKKKAA